MKKARKLWPDEKLLLVCRAGLGEFFLKTALVDQVFEVKKGDSRSYDLALRGLQSYSIRHLIAPHQSVRTMIFCSRIKAQTKISFSGVLRSLAFHRTIVRDPSLPDAIRQLSLLTPFEALLRDQIQAYREANQAYRLDVNDRLLPAPSWASMGMRARLQDAGAKHEFEVLQQRLGIPFSSKKTVLLFPGSVWATKRWNPTSFARLGQELIFNGHQVFVMGAPDELILAEEVTTLINQSLSDEHTRAVCLSGQTSIYESALLMVNSHLVVGNDSASTHLASVCETPLIAVFGPTVLEFGYRPWSEGSAIIAQDKELPCRPCGPHGHRKCPIGTHACMKNVSHQEVLAKAQFTLL